MHKQSRPWGRDPVRLLPAAVAAAMLALAGCASTGGASGTASRQPKPLAARPRVLIAAARSVLLAEGFTLAHSGAAPGMVATHPRSVRLHPGQADCGRLDGRPALAVPGTRTSLAYNVWARGHAITIQAVVDGRGPGGKPLNCVSTGRLEQALYRRITSRLQATG